MERLIISKGWMIVCAFLFLGTACEDDKDPPIAHGETALPVGQTNVLDEHHEGWNSNECSECHGNTDASDYSTCPECHGANGACDPLRSSRSEDHDPSDACFDCHIQQHGYDDEAKCPFCHLPEMGGTIDCK